MPTVGMTADERWDDWCRRYDDAIGEIYGLYSLRFYWRTLIKLLEQAKPKGQSGITRYYLTTTYTHTIASAIRREVDDDPRTTSLRLVHQALIRDPSMIMRQRYESLLGGDEWQMREGRAGYDLFATHGEEVLD